MKTYNKETDEYEDVDIFSFLAKEKTITVTVPIYWNQTKKKTVLLGFNWYRNAHFMVLNKAKHFIDDIVTPQLDNTKFEGKVKVEYKIFMKRRGTDGGNIRSVIEKFVLDSFVKNKTINEDKFEVIGSDSSEYFHDKDNPRAEITLIDLGVILDKQQELFK